MRRDGLPRTGRTMLPNYTGQAWNEQKQLGAITNHVGRSGEDVAVDEHQEQQLDETEAVIRQCGRIHEQRRWKLRRHF